MGTIRAKAGFVAALAAVTAWVVLAERARADGPSVYISGSVGVSFGEGDSGGFDVDEDFPFTGDDGDTDGLFGAALGAALDFGSWGLRVEAEVRGPRDYDFVTDSFPGPPGPIEDFFDTDVEAWTAMGNVWLDVPVGASLTAYVGGGVGASFLDVAANDGVISGEDDDTDLAWQLGAGFSRPLSPSTTFDIGYRYVDLGSVSVPQHFIDSPTEIVGDYELDLVAHEVLASLRFELAGGNGVATGGSSSPGAGASLGLEVGARTWISTGQTDWNHDASGVDPDSGNPTSVLEYEDAGALILEVSGRIAPFGGGVFLRATYGEDMADIGEGTLIDSDFLVADGGAPSLRSRSDIGDLEVWYATVDVGWDFYRSPRASLGAFLGYQHWREEYNAQGLTYLICTDPGGGLIGGCPALGVDFQPGDSFITTVVEWDSFRVGVNGSAQITDRLSISGEAVGIPYTDMHNEDSHVLRTDPADLGPAPNVIMDGNGYGFQGEVDIRYEILTNSSLVASVGFRYWTMISDGDISFGPDFDSELPLNDLDTERYGITVGLNYKF
ncbi:MAG: outer membrane beta-barrel protein [Proteobacteria bacterium]|nr:outer membrane beta-barrel protein [Pseudomonadota bacterium]